ncbi:hypothetical protein CcrColossus_gp344 [Caulobacter phage CcrColossus]|uniref:DUF7736 domain-containing protein n=1 Tax=Caulobacter phage CcrColossus TaxID=1211640 RepID=K4JS85_9CAUD|nr:hypothetical protein CcrColossus_gp344 [Caulobacter phage CcrColossus]AFU88214.1 hypothetical protein CcrColossus_gp344 [Caulobacter phage CcrColossus]
MTEITIYTKAFPTLDVLGATSGYLLADMGGIYEVLNFMTDSDLFTHQLPRAMEPAREAFIRYNPAMVPFFAEIKEMTQEQILAARDVWVMKYGPTLDVPRIPSHKYEAMDPISELVAMRGGADTVEVIVV